jgi:hypothetical protein
MKNDSLFISNIHEQFIKANGDTSAEAEIFITLKAAWLWRWRVEWSH